MSKRKLDPSGRRITTLGRRVIAQAVQRCCPCSGGGDGGPICCSGTNGCYGATPFYVDVDMDVSGITTPIVTFNNGFNLPPGEDFWQAEYSPDLSRLAGRHRLTQDVGCIWRLYLPRGSYNWTRVTTGTGPAPDELDADLTIDFYWASPVDAFFNPENRYYFRVLAWSFVFGQLPANTSPNINAPQARILFDGGPETTGTPPMQVYLDGRPQCQAPGTSYVYQADGSGGVTEIGSADVTPVAPDPPPVFPCPKGCPEPGQVDDPTIIGGYYVIEFGGDSCLSGRKVVLSGTGVGRNTWRTFACSTFAQINCPGGGPLGNSGDDGKWSLEGGFPGCGGGFRFTADIPQDQRYFPPPTDPGDWTLVDNTTGFTPTIVSIDFAATREDLDDLGLSCPGDCTGCGCFAALINFNDTDPANPTDPNTNQALYGNRTYTMARSGCEWIYDVTDGAGVRRKVRGYCSGGERFVDFLGQRSGHPDVTRTFKWPAEFCACPPVGGYTQTPAVEQNDPDYTTCIVSAVACVTDCSNCTSTMAADMTGVGVVGWDVDILISNSGEPDCEWVGSDGQVGAHIYRSGDKFRLRFFKEDDPTIYVEFEENPTIDGCPPANWTHVIFNNVGGSPVGSVG